MRRIAAVVGVLALATLGAGTARADKCSGVKLRAIGKRESALLACQAKVAVKGSSVEQGCDSKASSKFSTSYNKPGTCGAPDASVCEALADSCRDQLRAALPDGGASPSQCEAARLQAAGRKASAKLACYAKAAIKGAPVASGCLTKAENKFTSAFNKVSGCTGDGAAASIEALIDSACVDLLITVDNTGAVTALCPTPTTTTSTTTTTMPPSCDVCSAGGPRDPGCSPCATLVCASTQDPSCCSVAWDDTCVAEACTVCGAEQAPCPGTPCEPAP